MVLTDNQWLVIICLTFGIPTLIMYITTEVYILMTQNYPKWLDLGHNHYKGFWEFLAKNFMLVVLSCGAGIFSLMLLGLGSAMYGAIRDNLTEILSECKIAGIVFGVIGLLFILKWGLYRIYRRGEDNGN